MRFIKRTDPPGITVYLLHRIAGCATAKGKLIAQWNGFCWITWDESSHPETQDSFNILTDAPEVPDVQAISQDRAHGDREAPIGEDSRAHA